MPGDVLKYVIIALIVIITSLVLLILTVKLIKKNNLNKMYDDVYDLLQSLIPENNSNSYKIEKTMKNEYDYLFETPNYTYYIKIIKNFGSHEICINNATKWQIRKSFNDNSMNFVDNVEGLMRLEVNDDKHKKKLYIVYPNARSLLKYINECEMVFVKPNTDVYGTHVISYLAIQKEHGLIKL